MTAANLVVAERAAYLLTDSATYATDGAVLDLRPKVIASPELRIAIAGNGETWDTKEFITRCWMGLQPSSDGAIAALPQLVGILKADLEAYYRRHQTPMRPASEWPPPHVFHLFATVWSQERQRPEGYAISSRGAAFYPHSAVLSGCVYQMKRHIQPPFAGPLSQDPYSEQFDPERDGLALIEAQRRWVDADGRHIVGGTAQLTTVSEVGVTTTVLREWPDEIGRRIEPNPERLPAPA
jgi:hypothetical protein